MRAMKRTPATIFIVEDDPEISRLVAEFMRREGFEVESPAMARRWTPCCSACGRTS